MQFQKKFNVGLTLDTNCIEFYHFLNDYCSVIDSIYFSLPLGRKFHTRANIEKQFMNPFNVNLFWQLLEIAVQFKIKLELVLNTYHLDETDIYSAKEILSYHDINVNSVSILDKYFIWTEKYFPGLEYIFSYNNGLKTYGDFSQITNQYSYFVIGNCNIRNNNLFSTLKNNNKKVILLLNNGCSFNCQCCLSSQLCKEVFNRNCQKYSLEYLYALQSIMPFELFDGTIDISSIDKFKISNRSSDLSYLVKTLDSYINNEVKSYIIEDSENYSLWGRLGHFWPHFHTMDLDTILKYKKNINRIRY